MLKMETAGQLPIRILLKKTEVSVNKVWNDSENQDGIRPDSVKAELYANNKKVQEFALNADNGWTKTFSNLNKTH